MLLLLRSIDYSCSAPEVPRNIIAMPSRTRPHATLNNKYNNYYYTVVVVVQQLQLPTDTNQVSVSHTGILLRYKNNMIF